MKGLNIKRFHRRFSVDPKILKTENQPEIQSILDSFKAPIRFAFAYGSGVFQQKGYSKHENPMIDLVFGVTHPEHWHSLNLRQNPHHYSSLRFFGGSMISSIQDHMGAGLYYNPYVKIQNWTIKYGVIKLDTLLSDLKYWDTLYIAGRMQKPIQILRMDPRVTLALNINRYHAVRMALLLLPVEFNEEELFMTIAGLSYTGDFRMTWGEHPHKIYNIVHQQMNEFRDIYKPIIEDLPNVNYTTDTQLIQEENLNVKGAMIQQLPLHVQEKLSYYHRWYLSRMHQFNVSLDKKHFMQSLANSPELGLYAKKTLKSIVSKPAWMQSIKGILSAGMTKSLIYMSQKRLKKTAAHQ